ncbi:hypothetical protein BSR29_00650 [Boudabousia liubingyangii]|uniref:Uncharacterized protein n=1 Tax=Boudabousia liubingyangii TaxID=1921764 RepID=A0A1Q5PPM5_9ACTO|nr:hypothetical protein [Boudabousia liubingyangii]OKL49504.1 hypothetical protein BSR29_00650 [Boudabousia liubingyangii]
MTEREYEHTPNSEGVTESQEGVENIYGDTSAPLPEVEDAAYVSGPEGAEPEFKPEGANEEACDCGCDNVANSAPQPEAPVEEAKPVTVENDDCDEHFETPAGQETEVAGAVKTAAPAAEAPEAAATAAAEGHAQGENTELPEVETTMVTRRSLLGGASSTIPNGAAHAAHAGTTAASAASSTAAATTAAAAGGLATAGGAVAAVAGADKADEPKSVERTQVVTPVKEPAETREVKAEAEKDADRDLFADASFVSEMPGRASAHAWSFFIGLILTPVAWLLAINGMTEQYGVAGYHVMGLIQLGLGLLLGGFILLSSRWSTLGQWIGSILLLVASAAYYVRIDVVKDFYTTARDYVSGFGEIGRRVADSWDWSVNTGLMTAAGVLGIFLAIGAHGARKNGRRREELRQSIEKYSN